MKIAKKGHVGGNNRQSSNSRSGPDPRDYEPIDEKINRLVSNDNYMNWERSCNGERNPHEFESTAERIGRLLKDEESRRYWENDTR